MASSTEAQSIDGLGESSQREDTRADAEGTWEFINESDGGINPIASGMGKLLSAIQYEDCFRGTGWMDTAEAALYPVAAMEEAKDQG
jgi:hypothetical protein